jgi:hypothetical protein
MVGDATYILQDEKVKIWQLDTTKHNLQTYFEPVVVKMIFEYPDIFQPPQTASEYLSHHASNPHAGNEDMAAIGFAEPAKITRPSALQRLDVLRCWIPKQANEMKADRSLYAADEEGFDDTFELSHRMKKYLGVNKKTQKESPKKKQKSGKSEAWGVRTLGIQDGAAGDLIASVHVHQLMGMEASVQLRLGESPVLHSDNFHPCRSPAQGDCQPWLCGERGRLLDRVSLGRARIYGIQQ